MTIAIVPATPELVRKFYGSDLRRSGKAIAAVEGDRVLGILGVYPEPGRQVVFMDLTEELKRHPRVLVKGSKTFMRWAREARMPTHALCDDTIEAAARFLEHYGFRHIHKGVYAWAE